MSLRFHASAEAAAGARLYNVHRAVPPSGLKNATTHLVKGAYAYYHYMQDHFNDDVEALPSCLHWLSIIGAAGLGLRLQIIADSLVVVAPAELHIRADTFAPHHSRTAGRA